VSEFKGKIPAKKEIKFAWLEKFPQTPEKLNENICRESVRQMFPERLAK
jgi:hypothetical protein